jgi:cell surface protein SprA
VLDPFALDQTQSVVDTIPLVDQYGDFITDPATNPFDIKPSIITEEVEYDPVTGNYIIFEKIGDEYYRFPTYLTFEEYLEYTQERQQKEFYQRMNGVNLGKVSQSGKIDPMGKIDIQRNMVDRLFGGTEITIEPQGNIDLTFGVDYQKLENPNIPPRLQRTGGFDFDMGIQMNVDGKIGEKLDLGFNYNTQATFDFDNQLKLAYDTEAFSEDDIIKKIEAGNVNLPLQGSLIQGSQNLFGLKTELQFGPLRVTGIAAQQRSKQKDLTIENGALVQEFEIRPDEYDENRHFFLSHYFRENFEQALSNLPQIRTKIRVSDLEVWVTNDQNQTQENTRVVTAISYLGEPSLDKYSDPMPLFPPFDPALQPSELRDIDGDILPDNRVSELFSTLVKDDIARNIINTSTELRAKYQMDQTRDFEILNARKLNSTEYSYNPELGFVSLNSRLRPNQVLAVGFRYTYTGKGDETYQIGQLSQTGEANSGGRDSTGMIEPEDVLFVRMLKSSNQRVDLPSWDLMMKNVYPLGTSQLTQEDFLLDIFFEDNLESNLKRFLPEEGFRTRTLLDVFQLDRLNSQGDPQEDGVFDFVPNITVNSRTGSIFFPVLEPFGSSLLELLDNNPILFEKYGFQELYDNSITQAREQLDKNRFVIKGEFKSSVSSEISLGSFNIPPGSVEVYAGGKRLEPGIDYEIDYGIGRIKIINPTYLSQGVPIRVSFEDNSLFSLQQKTMFGLRADYEINKNFTIGGTYMRLFERPFTEKVNIGDDPINNRVFGLDMSYSNESQGLTRILDKLPLYSTKEPSSISFSAEVAALKPGHSRAINTSDDAGGVVSIDDFEGASSSILLGSRPTTWYLASTPAGTTFPEAENANDLSYGANRARLNWYVIDNRSVRSGEDQSDPYTRLVEQDELFERQLDVSQIPDLLTFDLSYYPEERGPYNFDPPNGFPGVSAGLTTNDSGREIRLRNPESRWAGITRYIPNNDFEAVNFEYVEFWMLNPFMDRRDGSTHAFDEEGEIIFNLGNVSEDVLKDNLQFYENSIPTPEETIPVETTAWGDVPLRIPNTNGFDLNDFQVQDLGYDGMADDREQQQYAGYVTSVVNAFPGDTTVQRDPSGDNFVSYLNDIVYDSEATLLDRYKKFNNPQGNHPDPGENNLANIGNPFPEAEDLNENNSLEQSESYYEYRIKIKNDNKEIQRFGNDFITDVRELSNPTTGEEEKWYRFQIPLEQGTAINGIQGFRSIQFIRLYMTGFKSQKTFRMAEFELVRNQWRRLEIPGCTDNPQSVEFAVDEVGKQENGSKTPFRYVLPRGIKQERLFNTFSNVLQDENSLSVRVCNLPDTCEASVYRLTNLDMRVFKRLQMFVHAEKRQQDLADGDMSIFLRLGKDFTNNYYEYEIPLTFSDSTRINYMAPDPEYTEEVWLEENKFDFPLRILTEIKKMRNADPIGTPADVYNVPIQTLFDILGITEPPKNSEASVRIKGNPSLGYVKGLLIGLRNNVGGPTEACAEVWVNELRMSGLEEDGGVAAQARMDIQLADLGDIAASGRYSSIGWGGIDQQLADRSKERILEYDVATNLNLDKFLPSKWGLRIPFYAQYSKTIIKPKYDPYELDLTVDEVLESTQDQAEIDEIKSRSSVETTIKTFNFTNVRKEKGSGGSKAGAPGASKPSSPKPWDISNFSVSYSYTSTNHRDDILRNEQTDDYKGSLDYNYSRRGNPIQPFKGVKSKNLRFIKEINFNPLPNSFAFSTQLRRYKNEKFYRLPQDIEYVFNDQRYEWDRQYSLIWDLTKSLKMNFDARNYSVIDELRQVGINPQGASEREWVNEFGDNVPEATDPNFRKDYVWDNIQDFGRNKNYDHNFSLSYTVPTRYIPLMDWINLRANYGSNYIWTAGSLNATEIGNVIQNSQDRSVSATFSFDKLYNKSNYLKSLGKSGGSTKGRTPRRSRSGKGAKEEGEIGNPKDTASQTKDSRKKTDDGPSAMEKILIRPLLLLRNVKFNYQESFRTVVPGYMQTPDYIGLGDKFSSPGVGFIFGLQPSLDTWLFEAAAKDWISTDEFQNQQVIQENAQSFDAKIELEPWRDFKIDINMRKNFVENHSENFIFVDEPGIGAFERSARRDFGSFEVTYFALNTLFGTDVDELFKEFENTRDDISRRLPNDTLTNHIVDGSAFAYGYGRQNTDVLIPAFLAAYTGTDANKISLDIVDDISKSSYIPKPNWTLRYDGLSKLPGLKDVFRSINISHGYKSTLQVNSYSSNLEFDFDDPFIIDPDATSGNYYARFMIPDIAISEQFSPIIGIDIRTKSDLNLGFEYNKGRNLFLDISEGELREDRRTEYTFTFGMVLRNVNIGFITGDKKKKRGRKSRGAQDDLEDIDLNDPNFTDPDAVGGGRGGQTETDTRGREMTINFDFSYRDDISLLHAYDTGATAEPNRGLKSLSINPSVDYQVNDNFTLRFFVDFTKTKPYLSTSYPITSVQGGLTARFNLN